MRVDMPVELRAQLQPVLSKITAHAKEKYDTANKRNKSTRKSKDKASSEWPDAGKSKYPSERHRQGDGDPSNASRGQDSASPEEIRVALEFAAQNIGESRALQKIVQKVRQESPGAANAIGW